MVNDLILSQGFKFYLKDNELNSVNSVTLLYNDNQLEVFVEKAFLHTEDCLRDWVVSLEPNEIVKASNSFLLTKADFRNKEIRFVPFDN